MRLTLLSSVAATALAGAALAQTTSGATAGSTFMNAPSIDDLFASEIIGASVYAFDYEGEAQAYFESGGDLEDIGEVEDLLVSRDGRITAAIIDVGGFLGIGERRLAVDMSQLNVVDATRVTGEGAAMVGDGDWRLVVDASREQLEAAPEFDMPDRADLAPTGDQAGVRYAQAQPQTSPDVGATTAPTITDDAGPRPAEQAPGVAAPPLTQETAPRTDSGAAGTTTTTTTTATEDGWMSADLNAVTVEELEGTPVYGSGDEEIGEISTVTLGSNGQAQSAIVDVGGFLGLGAHTVEIPMERLNIQQSEGGGEYRAMIDADADELREMPEYQG